MNKKVLKKVVIAFLLMSVALMVFNLAPMSAFAQFSLDAGDNIVGGETDIRTFITNIIQVILGLLGFICVGFIIYAGILYVTDGGGGENLEKAKNIIKNAVIGIIIIAASFAIVTFAFDTATGDGQSASNSTVIVN